MVDDRGLKSLRKRDHRFLIFLLKIFGTVFIFLKFSVPSADATNPCSASQFWVVHADGNTSCEDCESCPPGQGLSHECGGKISSNSMVTCVPCQAGISFSSEYDTSICTPCGAPCSEDQMVLQNCTPTKNVKCDKQCYSKDRYYDYLGSCLQCSKCCGSGQDVIEDECKQKLGTVSNMICSFHSSVNRCDITTKPSMKEITTIISSIIFTRPSSSTTNKNTGTVVPGGQSSPHPSKAKDFDHLAVKVGVPVVVIFWLSVIVVSVYYYCSMQSSLKLNHDAEKGVQYSAKDAQASVHLNSGKKLLKSDKEKLEAVRTESSEPLLKTELTKDSKNLTCMCQMDTKKDSKLLSSLLNKYTTLQRICEVLDTPVPRGSNYKAVELVAQHYGFDHYQIRSILENHNHESPTRVLIEFLAAACPDLTVEGFATVVEKKTIRNDVVKLLRAYDLAEENNVKK